MNNCLLKLSEPRVLVKEFTQSLDGMLEQYALSDVERTEFDRLATPKRKREYLGVRILLSELTGQKACIRYDANGKPWLADGGFHISISHSGNYMAAIAHPESPVGIDIECPTNKIGKLYKRFLGETEQLDLSDGKDACQLLIAWSAKEALYKIIGKEAVDFANHLQIFPFEVKQQGEITALHIPTSAIYKLNYIRMPACTLVYCVV